MFYFEDTVQCSLSMTLPNFLLARLTPCLSYLVIVLCNMLNFYVQNFLFGKIIFFELFNKSFLQFEQAVTTCKDNPQTNFCPFLVTTHYFQDTSQLFPWNLETDFLFVLYFARCMQNRASEFSSVLALQSNPNTNNIGACG